MPKAQIHRTYPCGMQESVRLEGWNLALSLDLKDSDTLHPCPLHGLACRKV